MAESNIPMPNGFHFPSMKDRIRVRREGGNTDAQMASIRLFREQFLSGCDIRPSWANEYEWAHARRYNIA